MMGSRVDMLNHIMYIDIDRNELQVVADGVEEQKKKHKVLSARPELKKEPALFALSLSF